MTWEDVTRKFMKQAIPVIGENLAREVADRSAHIEREKDVGEFARLLGATID
jgi:hypothetical protein